MNGHTPGPWVASLGEYAFTNSGQRAITTEVGEDSMPVHIAFVSPVADRKRSTPYNAPDPKRDANARLIAAAPELLACAKRSATALLSAGVEPNADSDNPLESLLHETLAAIARATGAAS